MTKVPAFTSSFALLDVKKGRDALAKLVSSDYRIPVTIHGFIQAGAGGVGGDDGVSREFSCDVLSVQVGEPSFTPIDRAGRPWALVGHVIAGSKLEFDGDFTCGMANEKRAVKTDASGKLYVLCKKGGKDRHYLDGQIAKKHGVEFYLGCYLAR